jgi:sarcosine oxidase, subunit gamma
MVESVLTSIAQHARSPLAHLADRMREQSIVGARGVTLREIPFETMISIRVDPHHAAAARIATVLGAALPTRCGDVTSGREHHALWLGPDEFLVTGASDPRELTAELAEALGDDPGLIVDVSANRTTLELAGPSARAVLEKGCALDLHPRVFRTGMTASTRIGPVPVILWQTGDEPAYRILPRSSFADYTARWLLDAMTEFADPGVLGR